MQKVLVQSFKAWFQHRAASKGAALAFYTLFSMTPILLLAMVIAGYFFGAEAAQGEVVSAANLNGAGQIVIAGTTASVARASERAKALGAKRALPLPVSAPFHCALMKPAEDRLAPELRAVSAHTPRVPVIANVDAEPKRAAHESIEALIRQVSSPVRWEDVVRRLASEGVTRYVEVGPGKALSGMIKRIVSGATIYNVELEISDTDANQIGDVRIDNLRIGSRTGERRIYFLRKRLRQRLQSRRVGDDK